jgi:heme A synthase
MIKKSEGGLFRFHIAVVALILVVAAVALVTGTSPRVALLIVAAIFLAAVIWLYALSYWYRRRAARLRSKAADPEGQA